MTDRHAAAKKAWVTIRRKKETRKYLERQREQAKIKDFAKETFSIFAVNDEVLYQNKRAVITAVQNDLLQLRGQAKWVHIDEVSEDL